MKADVLFCINTNELNIVSLREAQRRSNLIFYGEIAAFPSVARNDNVTKLCAFVLVAATVIPANAGIQSIILEIAMSSRFRRTDTRRT
jgi:hypothetical protein